MRYTPKRVRTLVEGYAELREQKGVYRHRLTLLCELADLNKAIENMPPKEYHAVLLAGLLGYTVRDAEEILGVSKSTLHDRYERGIAWITKYLNEGEA